MYNKLDPRGVLSVYTIEAKKARYAPYPAGISPVITNGLKKSGIRKLYAHQAEAIQYILDGYNVIITSATASGKSMVYTIPILNSFLHNTDMTAVYLTPAKALGQDQCRKIQEICDQITWVGQKPVVNVCDGDTPYEMRRRVLNNSNIIVSTIDMLHYNILPHHPQWKKFFNQLKYVILDEGHVYRGVFGNHVCQVMRRLRRITNHYCRCEPNFIVCTATIGNPKEFAHNLVGTSFNVVDTDTSPAGEKQFVFYEPPTYIKNDTEVRRYTHYEAARAMGKYIQSGRRVIVFGRSRRIVESMYRKLGDTYAFARSQVTPYKGTYNPEIRRQLEAKLFNGKLKGVLCTMALELGIDVGDLDVCILAGFPGSMASTWQQAGRVGRKGQKSLIIFMASEDPLDLHLVNNPDFFFGQPFEKAIVDPLKIQFMIKHILLASKELPLTQDDTRYWDKKLYYKIVSFLYKQKRLALQTGDPKSYRASVPVRRFSLRGESDQYRAVTSNGEVLEKYNYANVLTEAYPGAILSALGRSYIVKEVDVAKKLVLMDTLPRHMQGYSTRPSLMTKVTEKGTSGYNKKAKIPSGAGSLEIQRELDGYYQITSTGRKSFHTPAQKLAPYTLQTTGIWLNVPVTVNTTREAMHALEHLFKIVIPLFCMCERADIGTHIKNNRIYVFDNYPGGVGIAESVLDNIDAVLNKCYDVVNNCKCINGCPSCLVIPQCPYRNEDLDKEKVLSLLAIVRN